MRLDVDRLTVDDVEALELRLGRRWWEILGDRHRIECHAAIVSAGLERGLIEGAPAKPLELWSIAELRRVELVSDSPEEFVDGLPSDGMTFDARVIALAVFFRSLPSEVRKQSLRDIALLEEAIAAINDR